MDDQLGKEIEASAEERKEIEVAGNILNDGVEAGISPRSETDDDAPLVSVIKSADKNEGEAEEVVHGKKVEGLNDSIEAVTSDDEAPIPDKKDKKDTKDKKDKKDEGKANEVVHEEELEEVAGAPAIEFRKGLRSTFLRVVLASEAKNLIARRALLGIKNMTADRIAIAHDGESANVLIAERWYSVAIVAKPKAKSKSKAKSKAVAKSETKPAAGTDEQPAAGTDEQPAKKRGRAFVAAPDFVEAGVIMDQAQDDEAEKYIGRLYKRKDPEAAAVIQRVRGMRAEFTRTLGTGLACEQAYKAALATQRHLKKASGSADTVVARTGALAAAFPQAEP